MASHSNAYDETARDILATARSLDRQALHAPAGKAADLTVRARNLRAAAARLMLKAGRTRRDELPLE